MKKCIAIGLLSLTAIAGEAIAQGVAPATRDATTSPAGQQGQGSKLDQHIGVCLLLGNQEEVALAEFAKERAQNDAVKQFADMMIEQHQQAISKIKQAAPQVASMNIELKDNPPGAGGQRQPPTGGAQAAGAQGSSDQQMVAMAKKVAEECLSMTKQALSEKQGAEFDKAYIHHQVIAHMTMLAQLRGSQPFASQQLQPVIQEGTQMTEHHLAEAKDLLKQLKGKDGSHQAASQPPQPGDPSRQ